MMVINLNPTSCGASRSRAQVEELLESTVFLVGNIFDRADVLAVRRRWSKLFYTRTRGRMFSLMKFWTKFMIL